MYLRWAVWFVNVLVFFVFLLNFTIAVMSQSYEHAVYQRDVICYRQKAELSLESLLVQRSLGIIQGEYQNPIIIVKKMFSDDINERMDKQTWKGVTHTLEEFVQFRVQAQVSQIKAQNAHLEMKLQDMSVSLQSEVKELKSQMSHL